MIIVFLSLEVFTNLRTKNINAHHRRWKYIVVLFQNVNTHVLLFSELFQFLHIFNATSMITLIIIFYINNAFVYVF